MKIYVMDSEEIEKEINKSLENAEKGILKEGEFMYLTPAQLSSILTPKRIELLHYLAKKTPKSITEMAKDLGRDWKSTIRDLRYLEGFGFVKLEKVEKFRVPKLKVKEPILAFG